MGKECQIDNLSNFLKGNKQYFTFYRKNIYKILSFNYMLSKLQHCHTIINFD